MTAPTVIVHPDQPLLARAAAARLVTRVLDAQAARGSASVVLTGGGVGTAVLAELAAAPALGAVDWRSVDFWWGDERFLPTGDPARNETGARRALLDLLPVDPARVHVMHGPDGPDGDDPEAAAARYAAELAAAYGMAPVFDVLMLGMGPDAHVASLFPGMDTVHATGTVVAVHDSPKPPPVRISLTMPAIQAADEVWIVAAGAEKAAAVHRALTDTDPRRTPASAARGRGATLFLLDRASAADLPGGG